MSATSKITIAVAVIVAFMLVAPLLARPVSCPVCGARTSKLATVADNTNAPSRNLFIWDRSVCGNVLFGPDSAICTRCWHANSGVSKQWERASESIASFQRPLSVAICGVPVPIAKNIRSRVVFTQSYRQKALIEGVSFWCAENERDMATLRRYCTTNRLGLIIESNRLPGQVYVRIE